mmetsp:Transcript_6155/g.21767  ORF Transcript_6155/g.21767 Transcript_6155/m.21767 type:complete len:102 (+) Transcript_6155:85-390(+)
MIWASMVRGEKRRADESCLGDDAVKLVFFLLCGRYRVTFSERWAPALQPALSALYLTASYLIPHSFVCFSPAFTLFYSSNPSASLLSLSVGMVKRGHEGGT